MSSAAARQRLHRERARNGQRIVSVRIDSDAEDLLSLFGQDHDVQTILRHIDTAKREHCHLRIPFLLMRARARATVRVWKKRPKLQAHSRIGVRNGCGLPVATGVRP
jgi:hypothetical protein